LSIEKKDDKEEGLLPSSKQQAAYQEASIAVEGGQEDLSFRMKLLKYFGMAIYSASFIALFVCTLIFSEGISPNIILLVILGYAFSWAAFMAEIMCFWKGRSYAVLRMIRKVSRRRVVEVVAHIIISLFAFTVMLLILVLG